MFPIYALEVDKFPYDGNESYIDSSKYGLSSIVTELVENVEGLIVCLLSLLEEIIFWNFKVD